jgi:hypothetical protein
MRPVMERWSPGFRELLKDGSRDNSVGIEDVNLERTDLETAFPRCVILSNSCLAARLSRNADVLQLSSRVSACRASRADSSKCGLRSLVSVKHDTTVTSNVTVNKISLFQRLHMHPVMQRRE